MGAVGLIDKWLLLQTALCDPDLSPAAKVVMGRLLYHLNTLTGQCTPSFETLARGAGLTRHSAMRAMRELRAAGWVDREHSTREGTHGHLSNSYRLDLARTVPRDELVSERAPEGSDETDTRVVPGRTPGVVSKRSPKHRKREHRKGTTNLFLDPDAFDRFWQAYPKRVGKDAARKAFDAAATKGRATAEDLIAGAERYAAERSTQDPTYTKHPTTWLNGGHWADEPTRPQRPRGGALQHVLDGGYFDE